jgi:branched-chain amino acid transport system ATP-binding protein
VTATMTKPLLQAEGVVSGYGQTQVLRGVDLTVRQGEIVALLGSNGAGKSTLLRTLCGSVPMWAGTMTFEGREVAGRSAYEVARLGLIHVPEGRRLFAGMTVESNLRTGAHAARGRSDTEADLQRVYELFPELADRGRQIAGTLSGGQQQMVAIGRGLMAAPSFLMIDELSLGLAPIVVDRILEALEVIRREGSPAVMLVEQDVQVALDIADRGYVLENGEVVLSGTASELSASEKIQAAYLGL